MQLVNSLVRLKEVLEFRLEQEAGSDLVRVGPPDTLRNRGPVSFVLTGTSSDCEERSACLQLQMTKPWWGHPEHGDLWAVLAVITPIGPDEDATPFRAICEWSDRNGDERLLLRLAELIAEWAASRQLQPQSSCV